MGCKNANALGIPGQGFHEKRIVGYALYDIIGTIVLALLTSYFFRIKLYVSVIGWFLLAEALHYAFGTQTAFLTTIGVNAC